MSQLIPLSLSSFGYAPVIFGSTISTGSLHAASPGPPCLAPSAADISAAQLQPGATNSSIPGHIVPVVQHGKLAYKGAVPELQQIHLELVFKLRNLAQFTQCLDSIQDPQSANYGRFLNSSTLSPYLATPGQKASIVSFFTKRGFNVTAGASPLVLQLTGTVGLTEKTLGVTLKYFTTSNNVFYAVDTDPSLPSAFANLVTGIIGLDNYTVPKHLESPCSGPFCPQGIQVGYTLSSLYSSGYNGAGQTVAVVDVPGDPNPQSAINTFNTQYGLPSVTLNLQYPDGLPSSYDPGWASETAMDIEAVHSVAPGAGIVLLYDQVYLMNAVDYVASHNLAKIVSNSWTYGCPGNCRDIDLSSSFVSSVDSRLALDASQGLTILFASGDQGAIPGGSLGTEFPASDPNVLAIGATNLVLSGCNTMTCSGYGSETGASISGGGYSGYFSEPAWQTSTIGAKSGRAVPDVSMLGYSPNFWVYSTASDKCGIGGNSAGWFYCAGTSLSTPLWSGFLAIVLQMRGGVAFGNIGPLLYQTANNPTYSSNFHDIISGTNNGYSAGPGWDPVTGWGSPIASSLALTLSSAMVVFNTAPSTFPTGTLAGSITACGGTFTDGQSSPCPNSFSATANLPSPSTGWQFDHWHWTGGVTCTSSTANPASCAFSDPGSLTAVFAAQITFMINPVSSSALINWSSCGGAGYANLASIFSTSFGSVAACYVPVGYTLSSWNCSGGLACSGSNDPTTVSFTGPGTIALNLKTGSLSNPVSTSLTVSAVPSNPSHGTSFTVSGTLMANGVGLGGEQLVLVFGWTSSIVTVTTQPDGSFSYIATAPATAGSYKIQVFFLGDLGGSTQNQPSTATAAINDS